MAEFQDRLLSRGNLFFYATGNVRPEELGPLCKGISALSLAAAPLRLNTAPVPAAMFSRKGGIAVKRSSYTFVHLSFDVDTSQQSNALFDLLYDILFSGESCLIFQELSEKNGFIYSYDARFERYRNVGSLYLQYEVSSRNLLPSLKKLAELLRHLKSGLTDELEKVLAPYTWNAEMLLDDVEDLNWTMAYECHILKEPYRSVAERRKAYASVTVSEMNDLLRRLLRPENMILTLKGNPARLEKYRAEIQKLMAEI